MNLPRRIRQSMSVGLSAAVAALSVSALALLGNAEPAAASTTQLSMFEDPDLQNSTTQDPVQTLQILRSLGVNIIRLDVSWSNFAPDPSSSVEPNFNATDPNAYPAGSWAVLDKLVNDAQADGIKVDLLVSGGAPLWATQPGAPPYGPTGGNGPDFPYQNSYEPSASEYGQFVQAVATRYPSVHFWELWDEANWGPALAPQYLNSSVPVSANIYRGLLAAGWNALQATGHGSDTIVDTSLSQDASANPGETGTSAPLIFVRTLWCADSSYKHLTGAAASEAGCPTTTAGYQQFKAANPALFQASGVGVHPYPYSASPTSADFPSPDGAEFSELPQLVTALDRVQQMYTPSGYKQMSVYNTEYAYRTRPNDTEPYFTTPQTAAAYINEAEYISWKNPRIATYDQYELYDEGWFPTGLFFGPQTAACPGTVACPKPSFGAYRLPVWLPVTAAPAGHALEVWGNARPAYFARLDTGQPQSVEIQWAPGSSGQFKTVKTLQTSAPGYFDTQVKFPGTGEVRLAWEYPAGDSSLRDPLDPSSWIYSRVTNIVAYKQTASGYLHGVVKGHPVFGLTVKRGTNAPPIDSVSLRPPRGVKFNCRPVAKKTKKKVKNKGCNGLTVRGGKVKSATVKAGTFTLDLVKPASKVSITADAPFVSAISRLRTKLKKHQLKKVKFTVVIGDADGMATTIALHLRAT